VDAVRSIAKKVKAGTQSARYHGAGVRPAPLYAQCPDPDLLIRTSGEMRVSNFCVADFLHGTSGNADPVAGLPHSRSIYAALEEYNRRHRRFGAL